MTSPFRTTLTALAVGTAVALSAVSAQAATIVWNFNSPTGTLGTTQNYMSSGVLAIQIQAAGFGPNGATPGFTPPNGITGGSITGIPVTLFGKSAAMGDENGVGLTNDPSMENEITGTSAIEIDFRKVIQANVGVTSVMFSMGSATAGETWAVYNSANQTTGFALAATGTNESLNALPLANFYIFKTFSTTLNPSPPANTLLATMQANVTPSVPEPATWAMMLLGFAGLAFAFRQSRRKVSLA